MIALYEDLPPQERLQARAHVHECRLRLVLGGAIALRMEQTTTDRDAFRKELIDTAWQIFMQDGERKATWAFNRALDWLHARNELAGGVLEEVDQ